MPEILKNHKGEIDYTKVFMAFGAMAVLILQQYQSYSIATIKAEAEAQKINFMSRQEIDNRLQTLENKFMDRETLNQHMIAIDKELNNLNSWVSKVENRLNESK